MEFTFLDISKIQPGDVLLCYSDFMEGPDGNFNSGYSHAAICVNEADVFESDAAGVKKPTLKNWLVLISI